VKTERGILDVKRCAAHHRSDAPATISDVIRYGDAGLAELVKMAVAQGDRALFLDEAAVRFGPSVTDPEKILCVGLELRAPRARDQQPHPHAAHPLQQVQQRAQQPHGVVRVSDVPAKNFDYESSS
jgi:hypothetical protein